jgi:aspartate-semialdehyde dehydrogenase
MVGSVLMQRMLEERDFDHIEPTFFSTSSAGGKGPSIGRGAAPLLDAGDVRALSAQDDEPGGGDWTSAMYPKLREAGWNGYFIDAIRRCACGRRGDHPGSGQPAGHRRRAWGIDCRGQLHGQPHDDGAGRLVRHDLIEWMRA